MDSSYGCYVYHGRRFREAKGIILNTFMELEPTAINSFSGGQTQTPPVYSVGPLIDLQGQAYIEIQLEESIKSWLDDQPPASVVFLCFGSRGSFDAAQVKEITIGLERSGYRFLWSLCRPPETTDFPKIGRKEGRGLVCGWVPQTAVLAHSAIGGFVSHCGWNSILESLWFGVPIAAWPLDAEQHLNAFELGRELGEKGLVVELRLDYRGGDDLVTAEEVERGVCRLMDSGCGVRMKVKEIMEKSRKALMEDGSSFMSLGSLIKDIMDEN